MKFLLLYTGDEMAMARLPPGELDRIVAQKVAVAQEIHAQGKAIASARLWPSAVAGRVVREGDRCVVTDGPFTETKEIVGGFDLIECASREEALAWAKRMAVFDHAVVEVRPVWQRCLCHGVFDCSSPI
jgi:hypothetical protein